MNRTSDFFRYLKQELPSAPRQRTPALRKPTPFSAAARDVNQRLVHASESIAAIRSLMRSGNILGQDDAQIRDLIVSLNRDLGEINDRIKSIEQMKSQPQHAFNVAQSLRRSLAALTEDFNAIVRERSENIQRITKRRQNYGAAGYAPTAFSTSYSSAGEVEVQMQSTAAEEQQRERYDMVRSVEQSINEISQMYVRLSEILAAQDYDVFRIDANTEEALTSVQKGHAQLVNYYNRIKGNKCLMLKIFLVIFVFSLVFILIV